MNALVAVLPVCRPHFHQAVKWIKWAKWLSEQPDAWQYELVVFCARSMDEPMITQLRTLIADFKHATLEINPEYYEHPELGYASMANQMFRAALEMAEEKFPGQPVLWAEPDAIPTRPDWMMEIFEEYVTCGKPFMGDFHSNDCKIPHMTGNAVYPHNWREVAPSMATLPDPSPHQGWDTQCAHETLPQSHHSFRIQQVWMNPMPPFTEETISMLHPDTSLFHRCKDGTLIDVLAELQGCPPIPLLPLPPKPAAAVVSASQRPSQNARSFFEHSKSSGAGRTHILITSCKRDAEFTGYLLKSITKYARGFSGTTLLIPTADARYFRSVPPSIRVKIFNEMPGKGFLHHMVQVCRADEICPDADHILHMDPDCLFWQPATPEDFVPGGKCLMVREHYDIVGPRQANRLLWRPCVQAATGITPTHDMMVRHPQVYPRAVYGRLREVVEAHTGRPFNDYVLSGPNAFPHHQFCEYCTLGAIGLRDFADHFTTVDYDYLRDCSECNVDTHRHQYIYRKSRDRVVEGYSYNVAKYRSDWAKILRGIVPDHYIK